MYYINYNFLERVPEIFKNGWSVIITDNIPFGYDGWTNCFDKTIQMRVWDFHLWAHELTNVFTYCGV